jgi:malate dehydrogenase
MRGRSGAAPLDQRVAELKRRVLEFLEEGLINEAYELTRQSLPDARIFVQPLITWRTIHSTPNATANATLRFLTELLANNQRPLHGQVLLSGEFSEIQGVCGVPLDINNDGWRVRPVKPLLEEEESKISFAAASIERYVSEVRLA